VSILHGTSDARRLDDDVVDNACKSKLQRSGEVNKKSNSPAQTKKYDSRTKKKIVLADGTGTDILLILRFGGSKNRKGMLYMNSSIFVCEKKLS
jgi:hypothetical protein